VARRAGRALAAVCAAGLCAGALGSCGSTLQDRPIPHNVLEYMLAAPYPVYWAGGSFEGLEIGEAAHDPSDAWEIQYGNCLEGGEGVCVPPLRIVTSPDNGFLPGGSTPTRTLHIRGIEARAAQEGRTIIMPTGAVVVDIYASTARAAAAAARTIVPINRPGAPAAPLPPALPDSGFGAAPLPTQVPAPLRALP
jgi:hypothetical protein